MPHGDLYNLFDSYWWLLFPFFWMVFAMAKQWSRHARANRALDLIKSYADQGKEPPAELLQSLQAPERKEARTWGRDFRTYGWIPVFVFAGTAIGQTYMSWQENWGSGLVMGAIVTAALALGFLAAMAASRRNDQAAPK